MGATVGYKGTAICNIYICIICTNASPMGILFHVNDVYGAVMLGFSKLEFEISGKCKFV